MSANALRHVVRRREHRERAQPAARASRFGLLEKHKDYKLRANDFHRKEDALRILKEKAAFKNADEFYMNMNNAQTKKGVHTLERSSKGIAPKTLQLMKAQDVAYLQMQRSSDATRIDKAKKNMHFLMEDDEDEQAEEAPAAGSKRKAKDEDDDEEDDEEEEDAPPRKKSKASAATAAIRSKHVIFVDSVEAVRDFSAAAYFQTTPELVKRKFNRLKSSQLAQGSVLMNDTRGQNAAAAAAAQQTKSSSSAAAAAASAPALTAVQQAAQQSKSVIAASSMLARSDQSLLASYSEISSRLDRKRKIETALDKLQLEKLLAGKGRRKKIVQKDDKFGEVDDKKTVYKWKMERKK